VVTGTVQQNAVNGTATFAFTQGTPVVSWSYAFQVTLRADPVRMSQLSAVQTIVRGQAISLQLPAASGATGTYLWTFASNSAPLPAGLSLVQSNNNWFISGTVANNAALDRRYVKLVLSSGQQSIFLNMTFDARRPLKLYTQNMILFPEHIADPVVDCLPVVGWPLTYGACVAFLQLAQDTLYNASPVNPDGIHNTDADNHERAGYLIDHINAQSYDVVTLQEVWDGPLSTAELERVINDTNANYRAVQGPANSFAVVPPDFKINSGLLTLVKRFPNQPSATDHAEAFTNRGGGSDSWSNKGFVATQVFVTDNPNEFVWVISTHTHAQESQTRHDQFVQIQQFVASQPGSNPILIMGDFNVAADENAVYTSPNSEYLQMLNLFPDFRDLAANQGFITDTWFDNAYAHQWHTNHTAERLDYIMLRQGSVYELDFENIAIVNSLPNVRYTTLCTNWALSSSILCHYSDHFGLRADLKFRQK
jgi:endonuclease/exonuclease/phosphatase family metal-dependent hydrolase